MNTLYTTKIATNVSRKPQRKPDLASMVDVPVTGGKLHSSTEKMKSTFGIYSGFRSVSRNSPNLDTILSGINSVHSSKDKKRYSIVMLLSTLSGLHIDTDIFITHQFPCFVT